MWETIKILNFCILTGLAFFVFTGSVQAASIAPESISLQLNSGESSRVEIGIYNNDVENHVYNIVIKKANVSQESGEVNFVEPGVLSSWVQIESTELNLASNQVGVAVMDVKIPENTQDGVYILGVQFKQQSTGTATIGIQPAFVSLIFIQVGESLIQKSKVIDFQITSTTSSHLPVKFFAIIRNEGQAMCIPSGVIGIKNVFGNIVEVIPFNIGGNRVLAGQNRTLKAQWGRNVQGTGFFTHLRAEASQLTIGIFKIEPEVLLFEGDVASLDSQWIIIFPWRLFIVTFGILFFALGLLWWLRQRV